MRNELKEELLAYTDSVFFKKENKAFFNISEIQNFIHYFIQNGNMGKIQEKITADSYGRIL